MGSVLRKEKRKKITLNEWHWINQVLSQINHGQFEPAGGIEYRGTIRTADQNFRGVIEFVDGLYGWQIFSEKLRTEFDCGYCYELADALRGLIAKMTAEQIERVIETTRGVEDEGQVAKVPAEKEMAI